MTTTADTIMALAEAYGRALLSHGFYDTEHDDLRTAVESLVAERDTMKAAHEAIATLDHTRPLLDARALSRTALRGQP